MEQRQSSPEVDMRAVDPDFDWRAIPPADRRTTNIVPDRLSVEPSSEFYCPIYIRRVCVLFEGAEQSKVIEYCISEGWVRRYPGAKKNIRVSKNGRVVAFKAHGKVRVKLAQWNPKFDAQLRLDEARATP